MHYSGILAGFLMLGNFQMTIQGTEEKQEISVSKKIKGALYGIASSYALLGGFGIGLLMKDELLKTYVLHLPSPGGKALKAAIMAGECWVGLLLVSGAWLLSAWCYTQMRKQFAHTPLEYKETI